MAIKHEFYLIPNTLDVKTFWLHKENDSNIIACVVIEDDVIQYISDTLKWIPSKNPALNNIPSGMGINYHGVTLFDKQSSAVLKSILASWRDLFKHSPKILELTGAFVMESDADTAGHYETLVLNRDDIVNQFETIISFSERLAEGNFYVYHCGI